ncbi:MAG: uroporphyrinogen-III synthase [Gammaproteobacteria bacterium]
MNASLCGAVVIVTRPSRQAETLCALIEARGGMAVRLPLLEIRRLNSEEAANSAAEKFAAYDWVFFISANAVNFALQANNGTINRLSGVRFAAVGNATAKAMRDRQVPVDVVPKQGFSSEALLACPQLQQVAGLSCLVVRGRGGRELLADTLRQRGASVAYWEVYERVKPTLDIETIIARCDRKLLKILTITSGEALQNLIEMYGGSLPEQWLSMPLVTVSSRIAAIARQAGFKQIAVAAESSDPAIINTVSGLINGE